MSEANVCLSEKNSVYYHRIISEISVLGEIRIWLDEWVSEW